MTARVYPIEVGQDIADRCAALYAKGLPPGDSTGWKSVDACYTVAPQQWTLVTGMPGSGKSEWLDALAMNLAEASDWTFAAYSPENFPLEAHMAKLAEKRVRKPFGIGPNERMTERELWDAMTWIAERFAWLKAEYADYASLLTDALRVREPGKKLAVILDPWNTLEHLRPPRQTETEYISEALTWITNWTRAQKLHVFLVAHPHMMQRDKATGKRSVPTPYDIHGSAHWYNKADNIVCVHREQDEQGQDVEIHVQKVRFKHIGKVGMVSLKYDRVVGRYFEPAWAAKRGERYSDPERPVI